MRHRPTTLPALVALALVALPASASAATHDLAAAPTPAPPAPVPARLARQRRAALAPAERARHLEERQFLCGLFGTCSDDDTSASGAASSTAALATDSAALSASDPAAAAGSSTGEPSATSATDPALAQSSSTTLTSSSTESTESSTTRPSRTSTTSSSTTTTPSSTSQIVVTITSVVTNEDGSQSTMLQESASAVAASSGGGGGGGPSGKTWGIIGGVVGGVALLVGIVLVVWRLTQRRFANLDNDHDEIRWPELQPDGQTVSTGLSTLNPQGTRRTGGAGIAMEKDGDFDDDDDDDELDRKGGAAGAGEWPVEASPRLGGGGAGAPGGAYALGNNQSEVGFFEGQGQGASPYELAYAHGQAQQRLPSPAAGGRTSYYDPYLGAAPIASPHLAPSSSDPSLPLPSVYPPSYATAPAHSADPYAAAAAAGARNSLYGGMAGEYQVPMSQEELQSQQQPYGHYSPHAHGATSPSMRY